MPVTNREIHLAARPRGEPKPSDFALVETSIPDPGPGQVLVRNDWFSVDPYMRGRMNDVKSYTPPYRLGAPMDGAAVGTVIATGGTGGGASAGGAAAGGTVPVGAVVQHMRGWREYALLEAARVRVVDTDLAPAQAYLGVLGAVGLTAYVGLKEIAPVREGDVVFVSGAAGAVGMVAGRVARHFGAAKVIGSAGGPDKARRLVEEFGFAEAIDYKAGDLGGQLAAAAPDGIDVYFDNVGGDHLRAAISAMRDHGRIALCGAISLYNAAQAAPGPDNLALAITRRLTLRGYIISDHLDAAAEYVRLAAGWLREGSLRREETVVEGIEQAVPAFLGLFHGANTGKMLVRLGGRPA
jgi:NADPH-dependent curcumin reductase CurA